MEVVTLSSKFELAIPEGVCRSAGFSPGQRVQVVPYDHRIELIPLRPIAQARGFLRGIDTTVVREPDRV